VVNLETEVQSSPLESVHQALGARMIEFGGWSMPVQYTSILEEHRAVRERAGLFDLSHMGEIIVDGPEAGDGLAYALVGDPRKLAVGRAHYTMLCAPNGGIVDDLIVYRLEDASFLVVANAANADLVSDALVERLGEWSAVLDDRSLAKAMCAVQGPRALDVVAAVSDVDVGPLRYYAIASGRVAGISALIARTGYTGEDGFEIFVDAASATDLWNALLQAGETHGLQPCGLGARDTLRLEAGMPLYGNELDLETNPFEAGLGRVVALDKDGDFVGRAALEKVSASGPRRTLVGLVLRGRGIARHGHPVRRDDRATGVVTSGSHSPTLGQSIAMAYVAPGDAEVGTMVDIGIRDQWVPAEVVALPFYRRSR
jgi:aminomethyltransferase